MDESERPLTLPEVTAFLRLSERTVLNLLRSGQLPGRKIGRAWRVTPQALREFVGSAKPGQEER